MKLTRIAKRGPNKTLSAEHWVSASFDPESHRMETALIWFREVNDVFRFRVDMSPVEAARGSSGSISSHCSSVS